MKALQVLAASLLITASFSAPSFAAQDATPPAAQAPSNPPKESRSAKDQEKAQKKQLKANEKADKAKANAAKQQQKAMEAQDKATKDQQKAAQKQ